MSVNMIAKDFNGLPVYHFPPPQLGAGRNSRAKAMVQVIHGLGEHAGRYQELCNYLAQAGYYVVVSDLRGHGHSVKHVRALGQLSSFRILVDDQISLSSHLRALHPELPLYILGHSMGSLVAQLHMQSYSPNCAGYILSGSFSKQFNLDRIAARLSTFLGFFLRENSRPLQRYLLFHGGNRRVLEVKKYPYVEAFENKLNALEQSWKEEFSHLRKSQVMLRAEKQFAVISSHIHQLRELENRYWGDFRRKNKAYLREVYTNHKQLLETLQKAIQDIQLSKTQKSHKRVSYWLSHDLDVVRKFDDDPYCGFTYSSSFYQDFLKHCSTNYREGDFSKVRRDLPLYIFSGKEDPVGLYGVGVRHLVEFYHREMGFRDIRFDLYSSGRHEMFNEISRLKVLRNIEEWLDAKVLNHQLKVI